VAKMNPDLVIYTICPCFWSHVLFVFKEKRSMFSCICCIMFQSCLPCSCLLYQRKYCAFNVDFRINRISPVHVINTCL